MLPNNPSRTVHVKVPEGAGAGCELKVQLDDGAVLKAALPADVEANAGDTLVFVEAADGSWACKLEQSQGTHVVSEEAEPVIVPIPTGVTPGDTKLRVQVADNMVVVPVPLGAVPGRDQLIISKESGSWQAQLQVVVAEGQPPNEEGLTQPGRQLRMSTLKCGPEGHSRAIEFALAAGAFVSPKIVMGEAPPLFIPGIVAREAIEAGELICKMPASMHMSEVTCREHMGALFKAVERIEEIVEGRRQDQAFTTCVAVLLSEVRDHGHRAKGRWLGQCPPAWDPFAEVMMSVDFDFHPYWRWITDRDKMAEVLKPSFEFDHIEAMIGDLLSMHATLSQKLNTELLGGGLELGMFLRANLCLLTRQFGTPTRGPSLVPVVDLFNHSHAAGVKSQWDLVEDALVFRAIRRHEVGEELFISYGEEKSNALLFRTYGFTLPSQVETVWTFSCCTESLLQILQRKGAGSEASKGWMAAREALERCLSPVVELNFHSQYLCDIFRTALEAVAFAGCDVVECFRELFAQKVAQLDEDPALQAHLKALRSVRCKDATSAAFWTELEGTQEKLAEDEEEALRVKMGEYLCATLHLEALALCSGACIASGCLAQAGRLKQELRSALESLKDGKLLPRVGQN